MNYLIVYKTDEYRDSVIDHLLTCSSYESRVEKNCNGCLLRQRDNEFRFMRYDNYSENTRGFKHHHLILEDDVIDLLTEKQLQVIMMSDATRYIFGNGESIYKTMWKKEMKRLSELSDEWECVYE